MILAWSACFVAIKASSASAPPRSFAALRALVAGAALLPLAGGVGKATPPPAMWGWIALLGFANTSVGLSAMFLSVGLAGAALPAVLANSQALLVAPLAAVLFGESLTLVRFLALVMGLAGVGLVVGGTASDTAGAEGALVGLVAAGGLAGANLIIKHIGRTVDAVTATAWQYLLGALPLLAWSLMIEDWTAISWNTEFLVALLFLGVIGSAGASYLWYRLVQRTELIRLNALTLLTPFFSIALALAIYREPIGGTAAMGSVLILTAVTVVAWPTRPSDPWVP